MSRSSLLDKVNSIEQELLNQSSTAGRLTAIQEKETGITKTASFFEQNDFTPTNEALTLTWPRFKQNTAILAGVLSLVGFIAANVAVLSMLCLLCGLTGCLMLLAAVELAFWLFHTYLYRVLNAQPPQHEPAGHDGWDAFHHFLQMCAVRCNDGRAAVEAASYVSLWFRGAAFEDVKRENMLDLLAYGFWYKSRKEMVEAGMAQVPEQMLRQLESKLSVTFQDGYNPNIRFMAHLWEDLHTVYRPLGFYIFTEFSGVLCSNILTAQGFQKKAINHQYCSYTFPDDAALQKMARSTFRMIPRRYTVTGKRLPESKPIVFLHGVGLGVLPYLDFISSLVCTGHPIVIVEYRHVAMRLVTKVPTCEEVAATVIAVLDRLAIAEACFVGHSYGTFVLSRIVKAYPQRVHSCCFLDPVCLGMFIPQLLSMFVYEPVRSNSLLDLLRDGVRFCVSRELGISATMARRFAWTEVNLWPDDLPPRRSLVVFSGRDVLVPTKPVIEILSNSDCGKDVKLMLHENLAHGEFMVVPEWKLEIVNEIAALASAEFQLSEEEANGERAVRKKSLMLSLNAKQNIENAFVRKVDDAFLAGIRRTLSVPWKIEPKKTNTLSSERQHQTK